MLYEAPFKTKCPMFPKSISDIRVPISNIRVPLSDIRVPISDVRYLYRTSDIQYPARARPRARARARVGVSDVGYIYIERPI